MKEVWNEILSAIDTKVLLCIIYFGIGLLTVTLLGLYVFS